MNRTRQKDLGTPASLATETVRIEIDGLPATVKAGTSIMRACRESGVDRGRAAEERGAHGASPIRFSYGSDGCLP